MIPQCTLTIGCDEMEVCEFAGKCKYTPLGAQKLMEIEQPKIKEFASGAKSSDNKPPYECLTIEMLSRAAKRMELGMHYGKHNWKKGCQDKAFILDRLNHAFEHLIKAQAQIDNDAPITDDDLAAVIVNCMFAMEYQKQNY